MAGGSAQFDLKLLEFLTIQVLDIGSGSGYVSACMAQMVGPSGHVYRVEHVEGSL